MKRSERINRWFAIMMMLEKQTAAVLKIEETKEDAYTREQVASAIRKARLMVDQILSCTYKT